MFGQAAEDAVLVGYFMQQSVLAVDGTRGELTDQCQYRGIHGIGGGQGSGGIEKAGAGYDAVGLGLAGGECGTQRHVARGLFVSYLDWPNRFAVGV